MFNDTGVRQIVNLGRGGSAQQQRSFKTSADRLDERLQELRVEALKVSNQTFQTCVDSELQA